MSNIVQHFGSPMINQGTQGLTSTFNLGGVVQHFSSPTGNPISNFGNPTFARGGSVDTNVDEQQRAIQDIEDLRKEYRECLTKKAMCDATDKSAQSCVYKQKAIDCKNKINKHIQEYRKKYGRTESGDWMMFAKGGRVDAQNEMVEVAKENLGQSFALPIEIAVYVPSTKGADQSISENEFNDRIRETEQYLSELFGGYSKVDIDGGYVSQEKGLIKEDVAKVVAFSQDEDFLTNKLPRLVQRIVLWCGEWTQESIGFELEGDLFYIDKNFEYKKRKFASGGVTEQYYSIYDDEGDLYEFHLTANEVIDEANTIFYYDMLDADEEPMSTLYDAIDGFESMGYEVREEKSLQNILGEDEDDDEQFAKGGKTNKLKGDIGKSGTQYGYTLKQWEEGAKKNGYLLSPIKFWKSKEGKSYTDSFGRKQVWGRHSSDKDSLMRQYGYINAIGLDLGSKLINPSAKKFVEENNYSKYADGGSIAEGNYEMVLSKSKELRHHSTELQNALKKEKNIDAWVVAKVERASADLSDVTHYLDGKSEYADGGEFGGGGMTESEITKKINLLEQKRANWIGESEAKSVLNSPYDKEIGNLSRQLRLIEEEATDTYSIRSVKGLDEKAQKKMAFNFYLLLSKSGEPKKYSKFLKSLTTPLRKKTWEKLQFPTYRKKWGYKVVVNKSADTIKMNKVYADGGEFGGGGMTESKINKLYSKTKFINDDFNWKLKLLEMLQDQSVEAYHIYQNLTAKQKNEVLQEQFELDNDMGSDGDGEIETSKENLEILLADAKKGKLYKRGGMVSKNLKRVVSKGTKYGKLAVKKAKPKAKKIIRKAKIGFDALAKKVAKSYVGKAVAKKYQSVYGKRYSKAEAEEVGNKVAAKVKRMKGM